MQKLSEESQKIGEKFPKPTVNVAASFIGTAVEAKIKFPQAGQANTKILKSISGGRVLSLTDMYINGLRLKVM